MKTTSKIKTTLKMRTFSKMKTTQRTRPQQHYLKKLLMTPQLDRHSETKPEIEFAVIKEMYAALLGMHTFSEKTTF